MVVGRPSARGKPGRPICRLKPDDHLAHPRVVSSSGGRLTNVGVTATTERRPHTRAALDAYPEAHPSGRHHDYPPRHRYRLTT